MLFVFTLNQLLVVSSLHVFVVLIDSCQTEPDFSFLLKLFKQRMSTIHLAIFIFLRKWLLIWLKNWFINISYNRWMLLWVQFDFHSRRILCCITSISVLRLTFREILLLLLNLLLGCRLRLFDRSPLPRISCCGLCLFLFGFWCRRCRVIFFFYFAAATCIHPRPFERWLQILHRLWLVIHVLSFSFSAPSSTSGLLLRSCSCSFSFLWARLLLRQSKLLQVR